MPPRFACTFCGNVVCTCKRPPVTAETVTSRVDDLTPEQLYVAMLYLLRTVGAERVDEAIDSTVDLGWGSAATR